ncbi:asparagine synthase (glutamine-hydrolyzing) [uncultured Piscinibacter sp.]|uniref:asparagine synthase (glutamine-hydrolyzing) n=1 Tax=uncultured Piscinibacter sp. TaxID=1131835 RepID=UPI002634F401|nr:asparagine synthase (glutamine-hydrolyzing) [uncultured Piscinibacter sp.]
MCGIVVSFTPGAPTHADTLAAMTARLRHRGPDDEGHLLVDGAVVRPLAGADTPAAVLEAPTPWQPQGRLGEGGACEARLWLGHRRLAIVDLSPLGHQPMRRGEQLWAVYNGEVYNHVELRAELESLGHRFVSHSDTEVLLAAYQQWGEAALARFNGMWALVLFDAARRTLFVARDRFGVKPLYVWRGDDGALLLASEIKALLAHPRVRPAADLEACAEFLHSGPQAWREGTEFAGITRFPAGHWAELALDAPQRFEPRPFWHWPEAAAGAEREPFDAGRATQLQERYAELLADAVRLRMRADVRLGTALSGGLDSSSIAALVNAELRARGALERQEVFSSVYADPALRAHDESAFIARVAERLDVRSNRIEPRAADLPAAHERMVWALDTPPANTLMASWHTFRLVAERGVVVTLDGQGADEQLAGYARYLRNRLVHQPFVAALAEARATLAGMQGFAPHVAIGLGGQLLRRAAGQGALAALVRRLGMGSDPSLTLAQALRGDFLGNLRNLLLYADKTAMAWSVESRMPFMDVRLVEFLCSVPPAYKLHAGWTKWLARAAMAGTLPDEIVWRRDKLGWPIPEQEWFGGPLAGWLARQLDGSAFVREAAAAAGLALANAPLATRLRALNLAAWHRLFFEEAGRPGRTLGHAMRTEAAA